MKTFIIIFLFSFTALTLNAQTVKVAQKDTVLQNQDSTRNPAGNYQTKPNTDLKHQPRDSSKIIKNSSSEKPTHTQPNSPIDTLRIDKTNRAKAIRDSVK